MKEGTNYSKLQDELEAAENYRARVELWITNGLDLWSGGFTNDEIGVKIDINPKDEYEKKILHEYRERHIHKFKFIEPFETLKDQLDQEFDSVPPRMKKLFLERKLKELDQSVEKGTTAEKQGHSDWANGKPIDLSEGGVDPLNRYKGFQKGLFKNYLLDLLDEYSTEGVMPLVKANTKSFTKLKWTGTPAEFGTIISTLIENGYLSEYSSMSISDKAAIMQQVFDIKTSDGTEVKPRTLQDYMGRNKQQFTPLNSFKIPLSKNYSKD